MFKTSFPHFESEGGLLINYQYSISHRHFFTGPFFFNSSFNYIFPSFITYININNSQNTHTKKTILS